MNCLSTLILTVALAPSAAREQGSFPVTPAPGERELPKFYQLSEATVPFEMTRRKVLPASGIEMWTVQFPSPVVSPVPENNTVHAEYYRPSAPGRYPAVVVLDITGGDQSLSRGIASLLAQNGVAGLFVQMAYYGPRRPPGSRLRMLSTNFPQTLAAVRQTVLDCRTAAAWLAARPDIIPDRVGILGTSLGSFVAALTTEMEPRLDRAAFMLGGGGFVDAFYDHPLARPHRQRWEQIGGTKEAVAALVAPVDPLTHAERLRGRNVLMVAARVDEIVPPSMAERLWKKAGEPEIVWLDAGHYSAALYLMPLMKRVVDHFRRP